MSNTSKTVIVILVLLIIGAFWYFRGSMSYQTTPGEAKTTDTTAGDSAAVSDTSSASLGQDVAALETELNRLDDDSSNIDKGLNDQPVAQTE